MKIYCEHGAFRPELHRLRGEGRLQIVNFPYDERTRRANMADPSDATWDDLGRVVWDELEASWDDFDASEKYQEIETIIGRANDKDVKHVDAAYKSGCRCFFSRDKGDILSKKSKLEDLLGMKFFHPDEDWHSFLPC